MKKTKQFAGRTLVFRSVKERFGEYYIMCEDKETGKSFVLGLDTDNSPLFGSKEEALEYWNTPADGSDQWKGESVWGMEA